MAESQSHRRTKVRAAGKKGRTEVPLSGRRRLDAARAKTATEVERSGDPRLLAKAAGRLKSSGKPQRVLVVPEKDMPKAAAAMKKRGVSGSVKNMSGTKRRSVSRKRRG